MILTAVVALLATSLEGLVPVGDYHEMTLVRNVATVFDSPCLLTERGAIDVTSL